MTESRKPRRKKEDVTLGTSFYRWTVIGPPEKQDNGQTAFLCRCECGTEKLLLFRHLGWNKSCGCLRIERISESSTKHGIYKTFGKKAYDRWYRYGLTAEEFEAFMFKQGNSCAICKKPLLGRDICVDHCHDSNKVRGILCSECNIGLGKFQDDDRLLYAAAAYLRASEGVML